MLRIVTLLGNPRRTWEDVIKMNLKQNVILGFTWLRRGISGGLL
jgi:hypothetical protein